MKLNRVTVAFCIVALVVILGFDTYQILRYGYESTISWTAYVTAHRIPFIPLCVGVLIGHLYASQDHVPASIQKVLAMANLYSQGLCTPTQLKEAVDEWKKDQTV